VSHFLTFPDTFIELLTTNYKRRREFLKIRMVESQGNGGESRKWWREQCGFVRFGIVCRVYS